MKHTIELLICDHAGKPDLGERHVGKKLRGIPVLMEEFSSYPECFPEGAENMTLEAGHIVHWFDDEYGVTVILKENTATMASAGLPSLQCSQVNHDRPKSDK
jgi:hypothetical protein